MRHALRSCAAALDLASRASGHAKEAYDGRARGFLQGLTNWLQERMTTAFEVTYRGRTKPLMGWIKSTPTGTGARANVSEMVNAASSVALAAHFENEAPQYPTFADYHTAKSRPQAVRDALRWIAGSPKTQQATKVLDALELLDGDRLDPTRSKYARHIVGLLWKKGAGQLLNRAEFIDTVQDVEYLAPPTYRLEPEWVVVLLASLVYSGDLVLAIPGKKLDATDVSVLAATPVDELANFKHVERPKEWNIPALSAVFELLGLTPGMAQLVTQGENESVKALLKAVAFYVNRLVTAQQAIREGLHFWGKNLLDERADLNLSANLDAVKVFFESLQAYSSPGRLKNFRYDRHEVEAQQAGMNAPAGGGVPRGAGGGARWYGLLSVLSRGRVAARPQMDRTDEGSASNHASTDPRSRDTVDDRVPARDATDTRRSEEAIRPRIPRPSHASPARRQRTTHARAGFSTTNA